MPLMLKPQDIVVLAWLIARHKQPWRYLDLAEGLFMSPSEAHSAVRRLGLSGLLVQSARQGAQAQPNIRATEALLNHGVPYVFYADMGPMARGIPTGVAASPLNQFFSPGVEFPVWPDPDGEARGTSLKPLYRTVPQAARKNRELYELLALIDALRCGRSRERAKAAELLKAKLDAYAAARAKP